MRRSEIGFSREDCSRMSWQKEFRAKPTSFTARGPRAMNAIRIGAVLLLISIALQGQHTSTPTSAISSTSTGGIGGVSGSAGTAGAAGTGAVPGQTAVYRINLRVHNGHTTLPVADLRSSLE